MKIQFKKLIGFNKEVSFGWPEWLFLAYTLISWLTRILNPWLLERFGWFETIQITFSISVLLTFIFIWMSNLAMLDWYGKSENNLIFYLISYFSEKSSRKTIVRFLFILDPFLFFIYSRNGNPRGIVHKIKTWTLLLLSLLSVGLIWICIGLVINNYLFQLLISILVITLLLLLKIKLSSLKKRFY